MAFNESLATISSIPIINEDDAEFHHTCSSLSRLSICTSSVYVNENESRNQSDSCVFTNLESFDGAEADGEVSDDGRGKENVGESDSDSGFYSLPVTPSRRRRNFPVSGESNSNETNSKCNPRRQRRVNKEKKKNGINGENDGGEGLTVLTKAKGGEKSLRMGSEEVKGCRDLGFELEGPIPGRISVSTGSNFDTQTSSGDNSPIATWRISSPGDDPKEVKARLKVWAQAVALASASRQAS